MIKPISQQLSDLSVHAKNAEDVIATAQKEAHDKISARREQSRAAVTAAIGKVDEDIKSIGDVVAGKWSAAKAKIAADLEAIDKNISQRQHDRDVRYTEKHAERLEQEATYAVDYAIASIEQAKLAMLDALIGRIEVEEARRS
jgi:uncharacterized protein (UPF0218 family)